MEDLQHFIKIQVNYNLKVGDGIYNVTTEAFNQKLSKFLSRFSEIQEKEKQYQLPFDLYEQFPDLQIPELASEIFTRKQDLQIIKTQFENYHNSTNHVLEIGGWNGWLTSRLVDKGAMVITVDIFDDERNGLKSKKHYKNNNWLSIQTDLLDASIYKTKFDMIVFNHCLQFLTDPSVLIEKYKQLLNKNGVLLIIGSTFYKDIAPKEAEVSKSKNYFQQTYNFDIQFYPSNGYFSYEDFRLFSENSFKFISYKFSFLGRIRKLFKKEKSGILYYIHP